MELKTAEKIVETLLDEGRYSREEVSVRDGYSGRGMYGETTAAIEIDNVGMVYHIGRIAGWLQAEAEFNDEEFEAPKDMSFDSMGLGSIVY